MPAEPAAKRACRRAEKQRWPPFCAFNGGNDAWVDIGNKAVGVRGLCQVLQLPPEAALHVGDQFHSTGNDYAARGICPCVWVSNPRETRQVLKELLKSAMGVKKEDMKERNADAAKAVTLGRSLSIA